ncbi:hypothetical protein [Maritimibacter dapengensis]|uniref:Lipoprotein n=1 Tax=Maritimibacter dapengensis TaxID=2836868 RepID=A0ABS6SX20_9RHOB|nr:hypothetical protein [Maritimibacter dapengensis]MBV7377465.1 hypothetical protein [Maritimibacter dapengensis]
MTRSLVLAALVALVGCNSPSPQFMGGDSSTVEAGGMTFGVWRVGDEVEVIRTSSHAMPRLSVIRANAEVAIRRATGCPVEDGSLVGDQSVIKARLDCD